MTDEERFLFHLQGYLVVKQTLASSVVAAMNDWLDAQAERHPKWRGQTRNEHLENVLTWGRQFLDLLDNPRILPLLKEIIGAELRLDHDYAIFLQPGHTGMMLHGPNQVPFDPCHYYHCYNGR